MNNSMKIIFNLPPFPLDPVRLLTEGDRGCLYTINGVQNPFKKTGLPRSGFFSGGETEKPDE
jgi:hypothetical protein